MNKIVRITSCFVAMTALGLGLATLPGSARAADPPKEAVVPADDSCIDSCSDAFAECIEAVPDGKADCMRHLRECLAACRRSH